MADLRDWLVGQGLAGAGLGPLLEGLSERLVAGGVPLWRVYFAVPTVSPDFRVASLSWQRGAGLRDEHVRHDADPLAFERSHFSGMLAEGTMGRRWRLAPGEPAAGFPMIDALRAEGATDYLARIFPFGGRDGWVLRGVALSFAADVEDGFPPEAVAAIDAAVPLLALAIYRIALLDVTAGLLDTYVGPRAGRRVLGGAVRRGEGEALEAALLFADLSGFTAASEARGLDVVARLDLHLAAMGDPVAEHGGEVLKFLGDGLMAAFPLDAAGEPGAACVAALAAAREGLVRNEAVNRAGDGEPLALEVALHLGTVFYGNIGSTRRLDFTVIGPAVNELARMEGLCGVLGEPLLLSAPFARHCGAATRSLGAHALRGVATSRELFAPAG